MFDCCQKSHRKVCGQDGAYAIVRHPLYLGTLIAAAAPVVATRSWLLLATLICCFLVLAKRAVDEEGRLREQLGTEYVDYSREVKRLIPFIW